jgi:hypothetical protein
VVSYHLDKYNRHPGTGLARDHVRASRAADPRVHLAQPPRHRQAAYGRPRYEYPDGHLLTRRHRGQFMSPGIGNRSAAGTDHDRLGEAERGTSREVHRITGRRKLKMWVIIAAFFGSALSFVGAMWGVRIRSSDLKQQLQGARTDLELQLQQAHSDLKLQLRDESNNLEQSIYAQASDLKQQLTFEGKRDKRTIYAAALAALKKLEITDTDDNETAARVAVSGVALVAPYHVWEAARSTLDPLCRGPGTSTDRSTPFRDSWNQMVQAMRTDLGVNDPWQPATTNPPAPDGYEGAIEPTPAGE